MSRSTLSRTALLLLAAALPACRSGQGPAAPPPQAPAGAGLVQQLTGQSRILRHRGDQRRVTARADQLARLSGNCDAAVHVRDAALQGDTLRLTLTHVGRPRVAGRSGGSRRRSCLPAAETAVALSRVGGADALETALRTLVPTPEQYLRAQGTAFDRAPAEPEGAVADEHSQGGEERTAARQVTAAPVALLMVDADVAKARGISGRESEVDFNGVVGADGRLYTPRVLSPLSQEHTLQVMRALSLWRYQPARAGQREVPARVTGRAVLRLY